jgi:hypothetical protein
MPISRRIAAGRGGGGGGGGGGKEAKPHHSPASPPPHHLVGRHARDLLGPRGRPGCELVRQALEALGVRRDVVRVVQVLGDDHVHEPERQRGVGAGQRTHVPVGRRGGAREQRIDDHHARSRLARLLDDRPLVQVGDDRVRPPQHDETAVEEVEGAHPDERAGGLELPGRRRLPADRPLQATGAQAREEAPVHRGALHEPLGPGEAVGQHGLAAVLVDDGAQALADVRERDVPRDRLEGAGALGARAHQRLDQPIGAVRALEEVADLRAQAAAGERMLLDSDELLGHAVAHRDLPRAGIRAVVRASASDDGRFGGHAARRGSHTARLAVHP